jgi:hypothetical protein
MGKWTIYDDKHFYIMNGNKVALVEKCRNNADPKNKWVAITSPNFFNHTYHATLKKAKSEIEAHFKGDI